MSWISGLIHAHFALLRRTGVAYSAAMKSAPIRLHPGWHLLHFARHVGAFTLALAAGWVMLAPVALAADDTPMFDEALQQQVRQLATPGAAVATTPGSPGGSNARVEVLVGALDPRLRLAPCQRVEPYLPTGVRLWGKARIGLRCTQGRTPWNVYVPVTIKVFGKALVVNAPLQPGAMLAAGDVTLAEIDLAEDPSAALTDVPAVVGRSVSRALEAGRALRQGDLKPRQWFAAGDTVQLRAVGDGFSVAGEGQALGHGVEGQTVRVRTESGRVVSGQAVAERRVELLL